MFKTTLILAICSITQFCAAAQACDGKQHSDCLSETHYKSIEECNKAIDRNKTDFHAWLDRAVLEAHLGQDQKAVADIDRATSILNKRK